jgi:undecaprenyl-diphosphatase
VEDALARLGVPVTGLHLTSEQPVGRAVFVADRTDGVGPVRIVALGRDEADAQLLSRAWRYVAYRDAPPTLVPSRRAQVEYEAYLALLARDAGVETPRVELAGTSGALAVLVVEEATGTQLYDLDGAAVSDATLDEAWAQLRRLHAARVAHGKLDARHVLVDGETVRIVSFDYATSSARFRQTATDVAQLLAATTAIVGAPRAVGAAVRVLGRETVAGALPVLQPAALSGWTHDALGGRAALDDRLDELRRVGAAATGSETPELRRLYRVQPRSLLMAVGALVGVGVLLSRVGDPVVFWDTVKNADWWFVTVAFVLGLATDVAFGITFLGNVPIRLPVWPSVELQSAMSFSNLAVPVAADTALQVRFLQKNGLDLSSAVAAGGILSSVSEIVVQVGLLFLAIWLAPDQIDFGRIDTTQIVVVVLGVVLLLGVATAVIFGVRRIRRRVLPPIQRALATVWGAVRTPSRLALLIGGNVVAQCLYAASLLACVHAYGASINFWTLLALNIGISVIASLVPIPGGGTAVSAVGLAGMITAFGVPTAVASAAVLTHQLAVTYLPAVPGWFATNDLVKKGML